MKDKALGMALEFFETMKRYKRVRSNIFIRFEPTATGDYLDLREFDERAEPTITAIKQALAAPVQEPPPECQTEAEKRAYAFGWWKALEANRAAPVQEPVAWVDVKDTHQGPYEFHGKELLPVGRHDLYTTPPAAQRRWVGLNEKELNDITCGMVKSWVMEQLARDIEAKLKEKNT